MPPDPNQASAGAQTWLGDLESWAAIGPRASTNPPPKQAQIVGAHVVQFPARSIRPPRPRRHLAVRISVSDGRMPHGRSRAFRLDERDVDELIDHAARLEAMR
jgi:hypothetical protein